MPVQLPDDLHLDAEVRDVAIPVDARDESKGTVTLTLRELPHGKRKSTEIRHLSAMTSHAKCAPIFARIESGEPPTPEEADMIAAVHAAVHEAERDLVRWGVVGHKGFLRAGLEIPFQSSTLRFCGQDFEVASDRMLRLYILAGGGSSEDTGTLFSQIAGAVLRFQRGEILSPAEVWAQAKKEAEEKSAAGAKAKLDA